MRNAELGGQVEQIPAERGGSAPERAGRASPSRTRPPSGAGFGRAAFSSSSRMRWRISAAAALVKVMATIWPGSSTSASRRRKRRVSRSVFPDPAGACTRMDRPSRERVALELIGRRRRCSGLTHHPPPRLRNRPRNPAAPAAPECGRGFAGRSARRFLGTRAGPLRRRPAIKSLASCSMQSRQPRSCSRRELVLYQGVRSLEAGKESRGGIEDAGRQIPDRRRAPWRRPARQAPLPLRGANPA